MSTAAPFLYLRRVGLCALAVMAALTASAGELLPFTPKSLAEIKVAQSGRPFVLAFWSVTCEPCREEMSLLAEIHRKYPGITIVLVAADPPSRRAAVARILSNYKLGKIETWQFADDEVDRLRYSVDRSWRGELPRTYFFNGAHAPTSRTGTLDPNWVRNWIERESEAPSK
ncbi:MAG: TlpA family protein disulfide reductase [Opitutaceae bacterium]